MHRRRQTLLALAVVVALAGCALAAPEASHVTTNVTVAPHVGI